jgi:hypothetical protein
MFDSRQGHLREKSGLIPQLGQECFLPSPLQFVVIYNPATRRFVFSTLETQLNNPIRKSSLLLYKLQVFILSFLCFLEQIYSQESSDVFPLRCLGLATSFGYFLTVPSNHTALIVLLNAGKQCFSISKISQHT